MVDLEAEAIDISLREGGERSSRRWVFVRNVADWLRLLDLFRLVLKRMLVSKKLLTREPNRGFLALFTACCF